MPTRIGSIVFTFHNVSINFLMRTMWMIHHLYLHSTMFLLIHGIPEDFVELYLYLHSTMFLLIHPTGTGTIFPAFEFTIHNVSINSFIIFVKNAIIFSFTFHNVSINSAKSFVKSSYVLLFTFHNVSINSAMCK